MRPIGPEYMNPDHRLPTLTFTDGYGYTVDTNIPLYPEPSIFETTTAIISTGVVDHTEIERILARPSWNFEEADLRFLREKTLREAEAAKAVKAPAKRTPAKKTAAKKATPPAKKAAKPAPAPKGNQ